jgi:hypothetical protein
MFNLLPVALGLGAALLQKKPKTSPLTTQATGQLQGLGSQWSQLGQSYRQQADQYAPQVQQAESDYLSYLRRPVGSSAEDMAITGRAREGVDQAYRRGAAAVGRNPAVLATGGQAGALSALEHQRLAGQAAISGNLAMQQLQQQQERKRLIAQYLVSRLGSSQAGAAGALSARAGLTGQLLGVGSNQDAINRQQAGMSLQGLLGLIGQVGESTGNKAF